MAYVKEASNADNAKIACYCKNIMLNVEDR